MKTTRFKPRLITLCYQALCIAGLSACSTVAPQIVDNNDLQEDIPTSWKHAANSPQASKKVSLLDLIDNPELKPLLRQALDNNLDVQKMLLAVKIQARNEDQSNGDKWPTLDASLSSQRNKSSGINVQDSQSLGLNLNWEADVWGRLADGRDAARLSTQVASADYEAARNSLLGKIVRVWNALYFNQAILVAEQQQVASLVNAEDIITARFRQGIGSLADLEAARAQTASLRSSLIGRAQEHSDYLRQLALLLGQSSLDASFNQTLSALNIQLPQINTPIAVISQRPDLTAAYQRILIADKNTSIAHKALLPRFSFSASISHNSPSMDQLLNGSAAWSLLGNLTAPLFQGGKLRANADVVAMQAEQAYLDYQKTLLVAIQEVEASVQQEETLNKQQQQLTLSLQHSDASLEYYRDRYRNGLVDIVNLLTEEQNRLSARIQLLLKQQAHSNNRITLALALGMGLAIDADKDMEI